MADIKDPGHDLLGMRVKPGISGGGMRDPRYEIENDAIKSVLNGIAKRIGASLDPGWGFLLMLFEYGEKGSMFYISSAERGDCMRMAQEWIDKQKASDKMTAQELNPNDPVTRAVHDHWHKIVALMLMRMAGDGDPKQLQVNFKQVDLDRFAALGDIAVGIKDDAEGLTLFMTSESEAQAQIKAGVAKLDPPITDEERRNVEDA